MKKRKRKQSNNEQTNAEQSNTKGTKERQMYKSKDITKDCPDCKHLNINDDYLFICNQGKTKNGKILKENRVAKQCKLINKQFTL